MFPWSDSSALQLQVDSDPFGQFPAVFLAHFTCMVVRVQTNVLLIPISLQGLLVTFTHCPGLTDSFALPDTFFYSNACIFPLFKTAS